jgi:general secretion pathway protein I
MFRLRRKSADGNDNAAGFTLFEVVIALVVASLGMALLLTAASQGLGNAQTADRYLEATRRAQSHLAEIGVTTPLTPGESSGDDRDGFIWRTRISPPLLHAAATGKSDAKPLALYAVEATVSWREGAQQREVTLQSKRLGRP